MADSMSGLWVLSDSGLNAVVTAQRRVCRCARECRAVGVSDALRYRRRKRHSDEREGGKNDGCELHF